MAHSTHEWSCPAARHCRAALQHDTAGRHCSTTLQGGTAARHCRATLKHDTAGRHCRTALQHDTAGRHCSTTLQGGTEARHCRAALQHDTAGRYWSTTQQGGTTALHYTAGRHCRMQHSPASKHCTNTEQRWCCRGSCRSALSRCMAATEPRQWAWPTQRTTRHHKASPTEHRQRNQRNIA